MKNISFLMQSRYTGTKTSAHYYSVFKKGKRLKYMHICAHVNSCPHFVITVDQDTDLHSSRLGRGSFCKEVKEQQFLSTQGSPSRCQEHQEWLSSRSSWRMHSSARPELQGWGHECVVMSDRSGIVWILPGLR